MAPLDNDEPCDGSVSEVDLIGHTVPGNVQYNPTTQQFVISNTTSPGRYSIEYGIRGACGSYDTAVIRVVIKEKKTPPPTDVAKPYSCLVETGGNNWGGVDVHSMTETGFGQNYNFYDADLNRVYEASTANHSGIRFHNGRWVIEWTGSHYGFDQVSVVYVTAVEGGNESDLLECSRKNISPIAIDINDDGVLEMIKGEFHFDLDGDGISDLLANWFSPDDGILVQKHRKGEFNGHHLFGNLDGTFADGFEKLATLNIDSNNSLSGAELDTLEIWQDRNSNAKIDYGEISSLDAHGIVMLPLHHYQFMARASLADGNTMFMEDLWFSLSPTASYSE